MGDCHAHAILTLCTAATDHRCHPLLAESNTSFYVSGAKDTWTLALPHPFATR